MDGSDQTQKLTLNCVHCGKPDTAAEPCGCAEATANSESDAGTNSASQKHIQQPFERWIGTSINQQYEIESLIAAGGMGAVFKARHLLLGTNRAIKLMRDDIMGDPKAALRFEHEARAINQLSHANIVAFHDYGVVDDKRFVVMDLLEGRTLSDAIEKEGKLDPLLCVEIFIQVSDALAHAHEKGILHRDIKPSNIMLLDERPGNVNVKVLDFGIAKIDNKDGQRLTTTGEIFGSPVYMAPEQGLGASVDARSDVYSLGCVMYESLTGHVPLEGNNAIETIMQHVNKEAPRLSQKIKTESDLLKALERIIARCLEKEPNNRYQRMLDLRDDLRKAKEGDKLIALEMQALKRKQGPLFMRIYNICILVGLVALLPLAFYYAYFDPDNWRRELQEALLNPDDAEELLPDISKKIPNSQSKPLYVSFVHWNHAQLIRTRARGKQSELERAREKYNEAKSSAEKLLNVSPWHTLAKIMVSECNDGIARTYENDPSKLLYTRGLLRDCLALKDEIISETGQTPMSMMSKATTIELLAETYFAEANPTIDELRTAKNYLQQLVMLREKFAAGSSFLARAYFEHGVVLALLGEREAALLQMNKALKIVGSVPSKRTLAAHIKQAISLSQENPIDKGKLFEELRSFTHLKIFEEKHLDPI